MGGRFIFWDPAITHKWEVSAIEKIPFSPEELEVVSRFDSYRTKGLPLFRSPVSVRENYLACLRGEPALWLPMGTDAIRTLPKQLPDNAPRGVPLAGLPGKPEGYAATHDMFGVEWEFEPEIGGATVRPGKPRLRTMEGWKDELAWPDPDNWEWEANAAAVRQVQDGRVQQTTIFNGYFERLISLLDFENALLALVDEDEQPHVHSFFDKLTDTYIRIAELMDQYYDIDVIELHDDWGSQRAPLFSPAVVREMILPHLKRFVSRVHGLGMCFELHSCGCNAALVPLMIEAGADLWQPQENANDTEEIYRNYGQQITIGVACPLGPNAGAEEIDAWLRVLLKRCPRSGARLPVLNDKVGGALLRTRAYELSRRYLTGGEI